MTTETDPKVEIPRAELFGTLRRIWIAQNDAPDVRATSSSLASRMGLSRQKLNDYANGSRPCPDWVLQRLARECHVEIRLRPDGVVVVPSRATSGEVIPWAPTTG